MAERRGINPHLGLLALGMFFFFTYILARYILVYWLASAGITPRMIYVRDNLLLMGIVASAAAVAIPSAEFQRDDSKIVTYIFSAMAVFFTIGLLLYGSRSPLADYLIYNAGIILILTSAVVALGHVGFRGRRISLGEADRVTAAVLATLLTFSFAVTVLSYSMLSGGRQVSLQTGVLETHSLRYVAWAALAVMIVRFSRPSERLLRLVTLGLVTASIFWTLSFVAFTVGVPIQVASGAMDILLAAAILTSALLLWGLKGKRGALTPHFALGSVAFIWFIIAGAVALYLIMNYSVYLTPVPANLRLFHLMNANFSFTAGVGAVGLAALGSPRRLGWLVTILFSLGMVLVITAYLLFIIRGPSDALTLTMLGIAELPMGAAFLATIYTFSRLRHRSPA